MKKMILFLLSAAICNMVAAQTNALITKTFNSDALQSVKAETTGGNIIVKGVSADFRAELYAVANNQKANQLAENEIKDIIEKDYDVQFELRGNIFYAIVKAKHKNMNWKKGLSISFKFFIPAGVSSDLSTSGGNIELNNVNGTHEIITSGGNLFVNGVHGKVNGTTSGGNITVENTSDDIVLVTSGGNIDAKQCNGKLQLTTSGGNITMNDMRGTVTAGTSGGNIIGDNIAAALNAGTSGGNVVLSGITGAITAATSGGEIEVTVLKLSGEIRLSNSGGDIKLLLPASSAADLDMEGNKVKAIGLENFNGNIEDDKVKGKLNGGGEKITVHAKGGTVHFVTR